MKRKALWTFLLGLLLGGGGAWGYLAYEHTLWPFRGDRGPDGPRDPRWAKHIDSRAVRNLHEVSKDLFRGAQTNAEGFRELQRRGIKTIVSLRRATSDRRKLHGTSLDYDRIQFDPSEIDDEKVVRVLRIITDPTRTPVFLHCAHGADRTGVICAAYRVVVQGWSKEDAIEEMTRGGYGFHAMFANLGQYIRELDVPKFREALGLKPAPAGKPAA